MLASGQSPGAMESTREATNVPSFQSDVKFVKGLSGSCSCVNEGKRHGRRRREEEREGGKKRKERKEGEGGGREEEGGKGGEGGERERGRGGRRKRKGKKMMGKVRRE